MFLTSTQTAIIIFVVSLGTIITRFLPFVLLKNSKGNNSYITYLGKVLPYASIGLLVVYCFKSVRFTAPTYGLPEIIAVFCIVVLHYWKENTLLSIGVGTMIYMVLVQFIFK
jgi:branched-subunit amino acid transport protein AzlD